MKKPRVPLVLFVVGLLMWPLVFTVSGIHYFCHHMWRPYLDYFELTAALIGLICCVIAPLLSHSSLSKKLSLLAGSLVVYAADFAASALAGMMTFGIPN